MAVSKAWVVKVPERLRAILISMRLEVEAAAPVEDIEGKYGAKLNRMPGGPAAEHTNIQVKVVGEDGYAWQAKDQRRMSEVRAKNDPHHARLITTRPLSDPGWVGSIRDGLTSRRGASPWAFQAKGMVNPSQGIVLLLTDCVGFCPLLPPPFSKHGKWGRTRRSIPGGGQDGAEQPQQGTDAKC
jgi:hypothetical protein